MTQKELLQQIRQLREIKPRNEWVSSLKSEILISKFETNSKFKILNSKFFFGLKIQKSLAYSLAALLFIVAGLIGFAEYTAPGDSQLSIEKTAQAALIDQINEKAIILTRDLENKPQNPETLKVIASTLKTLADVPGTDLSNSPYVQSLYKTIVRNQIADLEKSTLTEGQEEALAEIKSLYEEEKYAEALEKILTISSIN